MMKRMWIVVLLGACQNQTQNVAANKENAVKWVADTLPGYELAGFSSASLDMNNDGYVSVDITVSKDGVLRLLQLDCPTTGQFIDIQVGQACKFAGSPLDNRY